MANTSLKFYRVSTLPASGLVEGAIYFEESTRTIKIIKNGTAEAYSGLQNVSWVEADKTLKFTKANGQELSLNCSDVASAATLSALSTLVGAKTDNKDAQTAFGYIAKEADRAGSAESALGQRIDDLTAAQVEYKAINGSDPAVSVEGALNDLYNQIGADGSVADQITAAKNELKGDATANGDTLGELEDRIEAIENDKSHLKSITVNGVTTTPNPATNHTASVTIDASHINYKNAVEGVSAAVTIKAALDTINGGDTVEGSIKKAAKDAAASAVATVLDGAPEAYDTLKEIATWIADNESAAEAADYVTRVAALETAVGKKPGETALYSVESHITDKINALGGSQSGNDGGVAVTVTTSAGQVSGVSVAVTADTLKNTLDLGSAAYEDTTAFDAAGAAAGVKSTIDNYTVNSKKISTNPVLAGSDIKLTGYTIAGSAANVADTDTINSAFGKVQKEIDVLDEEVLKSVSASGSGYVTADFGDKANNAQALTVSLTMQTVANASDSAKGLAEAKDVKDYVDTEVGKVTTALGNKNVGASGDDYVSATATGNTVTVAATQSTKDSLALADSALQEVSASGDGSFISASFANKDGDNKQALTVSATYGTLPTDGTTLTNGIAKTQDVKTYVESCLVWQQF